MGVAVTRIRWDAGSLPREGMVLDNFPEPGYSVVEAVEPDPEAVREMSMYDDIPEYRAKTWYVVLRPATDAEVEAERSLYYVAPQPPPGLLQRLREMVA